MDEAEYLTLVRQFMLALAPVIARHRLTLLRYTARHMDESIDKLVAESAKANAHQTLEWAMYLAAIYRQCHNEAFTPPKNKQETGNPE